MKLSPPKLMKMERSEEEKIPLLGGTTVEKYPWHLLRRTILLLNIFLGNLTWLKQTPSYFLKALGLTSGVIGPTLLDLADLVGATIGEISFILLMSSIGSMVGSFCTGYLLDKLPHYKYLILAGDYKSTFLPLIWTWIKWKESLPKSYVVVPIVRC